MRVVIEALGNDSGGGSSVLGRLLEAVSDRPEFSEVIVMTTPSFDRSAVASDEAEWTVFPQYRAVRSLAHRAYWAQWQFERLSLAARADVAISMNGVGRVHALPTAVLVQQPMPFYPDAARRFGRPMRLRFAAMSLMMQRACEAASVVFVQSDVMRQRVAREFGIASSDIAVHRPTVERPIQHSSDSEAWIAELMSNTPKDRRLLYVGSTQPHKNLPYLAQGIRLLRESLADTVLFATLPTDHPLGSLDGVQCLGHLSGAGVSTALENATALCLPSLAETVGLPLLEAMAHGLPVLAADRDFSREMCEDAAEYFDPLEIGSFERSARTLLANSTRMADLRARGLSLTDRRQRLRPYAEMAKTLVSLGREGPRSRPAL